MSSTQPLPSRAAAPAAQPGGTDLERLITRWVALAQSAMISEAHARPCEQAHWDQLSRHEESISDNQPTVFERVWPELVDIENGWRHSEPDVGPCLGCRRIRRQGPGAVKQLLRLVQEQK